MDVKDRIKSRGVSFMDTYSLKSGLKRFGQSGYQAAYKEMEQLDKRTCFTLVSIQDMTPQEKKRALRSLIFLVEKTDGRIKARQSANGSVQQVWKDKKETASPTAAVESTTMTAVIDAEEC